MAIVNDEQVVKVLRQYNSWWRIPSAIKDESRPQKRLARKDVRLAATGSASPVLEKGSADSDTGRWSVLKIPTMSFYEYCRLLDLDLPLLPDDLRLSGLKRVSPAQLGYFRKAKDNQKEVDAVAELPRQKILCEVKYRNNSHIMAADAIVELCQDEKSKVTDAFIITKRRDDFGITRHETMVPILRVLAIAFLYILGKTDAEGKRGKL